jgi:SAM-dependent methyltransferase
MRRQLRMFQKSLATRGPIDTVLHAIRWPLIILRERASVQERDAIQSRFDEQHGTDTAGFIPLSAFSIDSPAWVHGVRYAPTSLERFNESLAAIGLTPEMVKDFSFVDVGSGKGATLLYAADLGFKAIFGVELVEELHRVASRNLELQGVTDRAQSVCADATTFKMPPPPLVVFANYPFSSQEMMAKVVQNISDAGQGPKYLIADQFPYDVSALPGAPLRLINHRKDKNNRSNYLLQVL